MYPGEWYRDTGGLSNIPICWPVNHDRRRLFRSSPDLQCVRLWKLPKSLPLWWWIYLDYRLWHQSRLSLHLVYSTDLKSRYNSSYFEIKTQQQRQKPVTKCRATSFPGSLALPAPGASAERPWLSLVTCLSESGRPWERDWGSGSAHV